MSRASEIGRADIAPTLDNTLGIEAAFTVTCGDADHCTLGAQGLGHKPLNPSAELIVTADGGESWHSWLLGEAYPSPLSTATALGCAGATCVGLSPLPDDQMLLTITSAGRVSISTKTISRQTSLGIDGCAGTWCAATGETSTGAAYLWTSGDGGRNWTRSQPFPTGFQPPSASIRAGGSCPAPQHCIIVGRPSPTRGQPIDTALRCIGFGNNEQPTSISVVGPVLVVTNDGGATWQQIPLPIPRALP